MKFGRSTGGGKKFWCIIWREIDEIYQLSCSKLSICRLDFRLMTKHFFSKKYFFVINRKSNPQIDNFEQLNRQILRRSLQIMHQIFFPPPVDLPNFILTNFCIFHFSCCFYCFSNLRKINKKTQKQWKKHKNLIKINQFFFKFHTIFTKIN